MICDIYGKSIVLSLLSVESDLKGLGIANTTTHFLIVRNEMENNNWLKALLNENSMQTLQGLTGQLRVNESTISPPFESNGKDRKGRKVASAWTLFERDCESARHLPLIICQAEEKEIFASSRRRWKMDLFSQLKMRKVIKWDQGALYYKSLPSGHTITGDCCS